MKRSFRVLLTPLTYIHVGQAHRFGADIDAPRASAHPMQNQAQGAIEQLLSASETVNRVWNYIHILRDGGVGYGGYVELIARDKTTPDIFWVYDFLKQNIR